MDVNIQEKVKEVLIVVKVKIDMLKNKNIYIIFLFLYPNRAKKSARII